ncbi:MAG: hypothetical protein WCI88_07020 [Chloroflexota bacterium]
MKARLVITDTGEIGIFTDEGTFVEGKGKIEAMWQLLNELGIDLKNIGDVEQHRHDNETITQAIVEGNRVTINQPIIENVPPHVH